MPRPSLPAVLLLAAACTAPGPSAAPDGWQAVAALESGDQIGAAHLERWLESAGIPARVDEEGARIEVPAGLAAEARRTLLEDPALGTTPFALLDASGFQELVIPAEEGWVRLAPPGEGAEELLRGAPIPEGALQKATAGDRGARVLGRARPCLDAGGLWSFAWDLEVTHPGGRVRTFQLLDGLLKERPPADRVWPAGDDS